MNWIFPIAGKGSRVKSLGSFKPFIKQDKNIKETGIVACNSGSICSESKMFSYLHDNNLYKVAGKENVKGAIAYWIGKKANFGEKCKIKGKQKVSNCNYHPNYSYVKQDGDGDDWHMDNMLSMLDKKGSISLELNKRRQDKNWKKMFRSYALPCPGCFLNKYAYKNNTREMWNAHQCLENNLDTLTRTQQKTQQKQAAELQSESYSK